MELVGRSVRYSAVQYSVVQYSAVQCSRVQYSAVQYSTVQYSTVQYSTVNTVITLSTVSKYSQSVTCQTKEQLPALVQSTCISSHSMTDILPLRHETSRHLHDHFHLCTRHPATQQSSAAVTS
jgi:hypothetical protein